MNKFGQQVQQSLQSVCKLLSFHVVYLPEYCAICCFLLVCFILFGIYLTTLSVAQIIMLYDRMNNELKMIWKEVLMSWFKVLSSHLPKETENSQSPCWDLNPGPSEYEAGILTNILWCSIQVSYATKHAKLSLDFNNQNNTMQEVSYAFLFIPNNFNVAILPSVFCLHMLSISVAPCGRNQSPALCYYAMRFKFSFYGERWEGKLILQNDRKHLQCLFSW